MHWYYAFIYTEIPEYGDLSTRNVAKYTLMCDLILWCAQVGIYECKYKARCE